MAGLTTTQTFSDGDTVTAAKLNNIVSNCSIDADAVTTAKILDANVTLGKMATLSVDTGQLVDDAVQNSKLENMAASTVKANATSGSANPTDVAVAANKLLVGTSDSINAVSFTTDLELDAADSAAADIRAADSLIDGKAALSPHTAIAPTTDTLLLYDATGTGNKLRKATVKDTVQSQIADTSTSGVCRMADNTMTQDPMGSSGEDDFEAQRINSVAQNPMLIKAFGTFTVGASPTFTVTLTNTYNITSIVRSSEGTFTVTMTNGMPGVKYHLIGNGFAVAAKNDSALIGFATPASGTVFVLNTYDTEAHTALDDPLGGFTFMVFGLGVV